jgi:hypothetical protein
VVSAAACTTREVNAFAGTAVLALNTAKVAPPGDATRSEMAPIARSQRE